MRSGLYRFFKKVIFVFIFASESDPERLKVSSLLMQLNFLSNFLTYLLVSPFVAYYQIL